MTPPTELLPATPDVGEVAFAVGRAWRWNGSAWSLVQLATNGSRAEWLALGLALDRAFLTNRQQAERVATALAAGDRNLLSRLLARAYVEGRRVGRVMQGVRLGVGTTLTRAQQRAWVDQAQALAARYTESIERAVDEATGVTVAQVRTWVSGTANQAAWAGHDTEADEVAVLAEAEFKVWVRAWPRKAVRDWHDELEGVSIPIEASFILQGGPNAGARVYGPRDWQSVSDPGEHMQCGHALRFERVLSREDATSALAARGVLYDPRPAR